MTVIQRLLPYGVCLGFVAVAWSGGCAPPQTRVCEIDAQADPILKQMCKVLDNASTLRFRVNATMDRKVETGQLAQFHRSSSVTMIRPDRLFAKTDSDDGHWTAWYQGKTLTVLDRDDNRYATEKVPGRLDEMFDYMADNYDVIIPMADLLVGKTYDSLLADVEEGSYVGLHAVGDASCHHLLFRQENLDWQIWIDAGSQPLPRKLVITYTQQPDQPQYVATIDEWNLTPTVSDQLFQFTPPDNAQSVPMADLTSEEGE